MIGIVCLIALGLLLEEPARGQVEHAELEPSTLKEDLKYLKSV